MRFNPTRRLDVFRTLSDGLQVAVGTLAQDKSGVYFAYEADYLAQFGNLSPFALKADTRLQAAPPQPHYGLHGVFADSLPVGTQMKVVANLSIQDPCGMGVFDCELHWTDAPEDARAKLPAGGLVAKASLNVYSPKDGKVV